MEFQCGPRSRGGLGGRSPSAADVVGDVAADEFASDGIVERGPHDHVHLGDRLGREPGSLPAAGRGELFVEVVEVIGAESTQRDVADRWVDVAIDEPRVPVGGCRSDVSSLVRHPRAGQELANGDGPAARRLGRRCVRCRVGRRRLRLRCGHGRSGSTGDARDRSADRVRRRRRHRSGCCVQRCRSSTVIDHFGTNPKIG